MHQNSERIRPCPEQDDRREMELMALARRRTEIDLELGELEDRRRELVEERRSVKARFAKIMGPAR